MYARQLCFLVCVLVGTTTLVPPVASAAAADPPVALSPPALAVRPPTGPAENEPDIVRQVADEAVRRIGCIEVGGSYVGPPPCGSDDDKVRLEAGPIVVGVEDEIHKAIGRAAVEECEALAGIAPIPRTVCRALEVNNGLGT